ncbi:hypothetical protein ACHAXM_002629 [Skeletonema potamos]
MIASRLLLRFPLLLLLLHPCGGREVVVIKQINETARSSSGSSQHHNIRRLHETGVHREYYCSLKHAPITRVAMNDTIGKVYEVNDTDNTNPKQIYTVKPCDCFLGLVNSTSFCPAESTYCSISVAYNYHYSYMTSPNEDHDPTVECFRDTELKGFARYVFKYCTIIIVALIIVLIFTDTGRNVTIYVLSRCFPYINTRHIERRLTSEIESQRQHFFRWRERVSEEGYILGLKLKTKIYRPKPKDDAIDVDNDEGVDCCSICILELEDGDRIADLNCNHYFHSDCLSEWLKKKVNSCPLCQAEGIADEIRSYDIETAEHEVTGLPMEND